MSEIKNDTPKKKLLENPILGSLMVPIAIVLVGALIVFGVTKMLNSDRSYKDLVREMKSKTFGNRWIAAYELSKLISTSQIPEDELPWLITNLSELYDSTEDPRSKDFIVVALGALKQPSCLPVLKKAVQHTDPNIRFHAVVAYANLPYGSVQDWQIIENLLKSEDQPLLQASILALGTHRVESAHQAIRTHLTHPAQSIKYAAAQALVNFKDPAALEVIEAIFQLDAESITQSNLEPQQIKNLKLSILTKIGQVKWDDARGLLERRVEIEQDMTILAKEREVLNILKN